MSDDLCKIDLQFVRQVVRGVSWTETRMKFYYSQWEFHFNMFVRHDKVDGKYMKDEICNTWVGDFK